MSAPERKKRNRFVFRPAVTESRLEDRLVLSSTSYKVYLVTPPTAVAPAGVTPAPAPSPVSPAAARRASQPLTVARLRTAYRQQIHAATRDLRAAIRSQVSALNANGGTPTPQQMADFNARIAGALDATALRLSTQASLLPNSDRLVSSIQNALLGSRPRSFTSRLEALAGSGQLIRANGAIAPALARLTNTSTSQNVGLINGFFNSTPVSRLSVNGSGQRVPLEQFLGGRLLGQVGNTLGLLASSFPGVANSMLFPNGSTTGAPSQSALNAFNSMFSNALNTAAFQLGSGLALFPNSSSLISQINPLLFGSTTGNIGVNGTPGPAGITATGGSTQALGLGGSALGGGNTPSSLFSALQNLQFGSPGFNTSVANAFGNAFSNLVTPLSKFFGLTGQLNTTLPTSGFTSLFGTPFTGSSFFNGFNNGFLTGTGPGFVGSGSSPIGFVGFGTLPSGFNSNFGTGFNSFVNTFNQGLGFGASNLALGSGAGVNGIGSGLTNFGIGSGLTNFGVGSGTITGTGAGIGGTSIGGTSIGGSGFGGIGIGIA